MKKANKETTEQTVDQNADLLTIDQAAAVLGVTRASVYYAIQRGDLPSVIVLGKTGVRRADLPLYQPRQYRDRPGSKGKGGRPKKA